MFPRLSCLLIALASSPSAFAQTVEETVAFLMRGVERHHDIGDFEISRSPNATKFQFERDSHSNYLSIIVVIRKTDDCRFGITSLMNDGVSRLRIENVDFSRIERIEAVVVKGSNHDLATFLRFSGSGYKIMQPESDMGTATTLAVGAVDQTRIDKALKYMHSKFCAPKAF